MASINLSILSAFWQRIKDYFNSNCEDATVLFEGSSQNVQLSESIDNFERIEITWKSNDPPHLVIEFVPSLTNTYVTMGSHFAYANGSTYVKIITYAIDSNRKRLYAFKEIEASFTFGNNSTVSRTQQTDFSRILKVRGIHRIASS